MKKLLACFLAVVMLTAGLFGCAKENNVTVITYDTNITTATTETTETEEVTTEPTESEMETTLKHFEMMYCDAATQRDAVGNIWLNVIVAYQNVSNEVISMGYGDIRVYADGEEGILLSQVPCYPQAERSIVVTAEQKARFCNDGGLPHLLEQLTQELGKSGRILVRPSGTESLIRILVQGDDPQKLESIAERIATHIRSV